MLELVEKATSDGDADDTLTLPYDLRQKGRQRVRLDSGREAGVLLPPGTHLRCGDRLLAADGTAVRVQAAPEDVTVARSDDPLLLARACYHLGNRHVALQVGNGWLRFQPDHVLDEMVRGLGLAVTRESARFEPEGGAYPASRDATQAKSAGPGATQISPTEHDHAHGSASAHAHPHGSTGHRH